jgi:hypothetical protein
MYFVLIYLFCWRNHKFAGIFYKPCIVRPIQYKHTTCHFQQYYSYIVAVSFIGGGNHWPVASHWQTLSHIVVHLAWAGFELTTSVVIGTDCIGNCKSNYHMITATTAPSSFFDYLFKCLPVDTFSVDIWWNEIIICKWQLIFLIYSWLH